MFSSFSDEKRILQPSGERSMTCGGVDGGLDALGAVGCFAVHYVDFSVCVCRD